MADATVKRVIENSAGMHGVFIWKDVPKCLTEELRWNDNEQGDSCIPDGIYTCTRHNSPDHPNTWQINNVPNRTDVLLHTGNTMKDTKGCILVGSSFTDTGVAASQIALDKLNSELPDTFTLEVVTLH